MQTIVLPLPPSLNRYYRNVKGMVLLSAEGRAYKVAVRKAVEEQAIEPLGTARLGMRVVVERPDARRADLDNVLKGLLDALEDAGVYENDGQIDTIEVLRGPMRKVGGIVTVSVWPVKVPAPGSLDALRIERAAS